MGHPTQSDKRLERKRNKLRAVVRDDTRPDLGELFSPSLNNDFDIFFLASLLGSQNGRGNDYSHLKGHISSRRSRRYSDMIHPHANAGVRLLAGQILSPSLRPFLKVSTKQIGPFEYAIHAAGRNGYNIFIYHLIRQTTIPLVGMRQGISDNGLLLPV